MKPYKGPVIFVGGAPRSGTTVAHALLCTSERAHRYCPETSFLFPLFNSYRVGVENWSIHTAAFYPDQEVFSGRMRGIVRTALADVWQALSRPDVLCAKDPLLTPLFYWVNRLLRKQAKFVTVVRNPIDIVRSRQDVIEKLGKSFTESDARAIAAEINHSYTHLTAADMQSSVFVIRYDDLTNNARIEALRQFTGFLDLSPEKVWSENARAKQSATADPWFSPKYHSPINFERRLDPLRPEFRHVVEQQCAPLMKRFGYQDV